MVHWAEKSKIAKLPIFGKYLQIEGEKLAARLEALQRRLQGIKAHVTGPLRRMKNFVDRATSPYFKRIAQAYMNSIQKRGILAKVIRGLGKIAGITKRIAKKLISPLFHPVVQALLLLYDLAGLVYNLIKGHLTWFWGAQGDPTSMEWEKGKGEGEEKGEEEKGVVELGKLLRTVKFSEMPPDEIEALNKAGCTFDLTDRIARCEHEMIMIKKNKIMIITDIYIGNIKFLPREESTKEDTIRELVELNFPKTDIELVKKGLARVKKGAAAIIYQISGDPRRMESYLTPIDVFETIPVKKS